MTSAPVDLSFRRTAESVVFWIHVTPRARQAHVGGTHGGALRVRVTAAPVGGAANEACARALADALQVDRDAVDLARKATGRRKRVSVSGDPEALQRRLAMLARLGSSD
ncbi:MAG: DUF167 domain-containing protein [Myxococcales bacterium]|nr:DUF167 domain-containing protein [Myxococcales bacterium]MDH5567616.1 DUF167 domain-containing protein [Myxococcales bacterium]